MVFLGEIAMQTVARNANTRRESAFWRAVDLRDSRMDGAFVYAVRSTGVYCLPSCPARRPRRSRVVFFRSAAEARRNGFRACKRCWRQNEARLVEAAAVTHLCRLLESSSGQSEYRLCIA